MIAAPMTFGTSQSTVSAPLLVAPAAESLTTKSEGNLKRAISAGPFLKKASAESLAGDYSQVSHILRQLRSPLQFVCGSTSRGRGCFDFCLFSIENFRGEERDHQRGIDI